MRKPWTLKFYSEEGTVHAVNQISEYPRQKKQHTEYFSNFPLTVTGRSDACIKQLNPECTSWHTWLYLLYILTSLSLCELLSLLGKGASNAKTTQFAIIVVRIKISNAVGNVKKIMEQRNTKSHNKMKTPAKDKANKT